MKKEPLPLKIIHVTFPDMINDNLFPQDDERFFTSSWANTVAARIKEYDRDLTIECWRFDRMVDSIRTREVNGVIVKLFPVKRSSLLVIKLNQLVGELKKEQSRFNILVHMHSFYNMAAFALVNKLKKLPVFITNHGTPVPRPAWGIKGIKSTIKWIFLRRGFRQIAYIFPASNDERAFVQKYMDSKDVSPTYCLGIDFTTFKPMDKERVKEQLGIDAGAFVLGYTGTLYELKGFELVLELFKAIKKLHKTELICIGATPDDPFYSQAKAEGARIFERDYDSLNVPLVLNAVDVYLNLTFRNKAFLGSGGMGIASIEAMACNIPVVSFALKHFPNPDEVHHVGVIPRDEDDILPSVLAIMKNMSEHKNGRATAIRYLSWDTVLSNMLRQYKRFAARYYGNLKEMQ